jgi:aryl-alcohol dehydrogenase-like predicted oxidoreductase
MQLDSIPAGLAGARPVLVKLRELLGRFGLTPAAAALPFVLTIDPDCIVVGADTIEHLEALVASASSVLPDELFPALETELSSIPDSVIDPRTWPTN